MSSSRPRIVVLGAAGLEPPPFIDELADAVDLDYVDADALSEAISGADALFLWDFFSTAVKQAWPHRSDGLRWIHVAAAGVDSLIFEDLRSSDVVVTNARGVFDRPIAEYVLASILAFDKRLHESMAFQREHAWQHRETTQLQGQRVLIVGTGGIARETARLLTAVGCEVRGAGRTERSEDPDFGEVLLSNELPSYIEWADHVVNASPLTAQTTDLFDAAVFEAMRPGSHIVNIGRGASVVEADLVRALESGHLGGASLDVFQTEPLPEDSPLWDLPGVAISAHLSGDVHGWRDVLARQFVDNAHRWLAGEPVFNVVDKELGYVPGGK